MTKPTTFHDVAQELMKQAIEGKRSSEAPSEAVSRRSTLDEQIREIDATKRQD
jgi:hypothetical protein